MIEVKNLYKSFGNTQVLSQINLEVAAEESLAIIGFSGCGKSTLLKIISGLEAHNKGSIKLGSKRIGMCFQYSALFDSMTVHDNIAFALRNEESKLSTDEIKSRVSNVLRKVGLAKTEDLYPSELSGGMKKRVSFARAIVNDPDIILYDEPTAGLDPVASTIIEDLMVQIQEDVKASSIVVTHQESTIRRTANKVALLYDKSIAWEGSPEELFDPKNKNEFAIQFREGSTSGPMKVAF